MKKQVIEITCDKCPRKVETQMTKDIADKGWLSVTLKVVGTYGRPRNINLCPIHSKSLLKGLLSVH